MNPDTPDLISTFERFASIFYPGCDPRLISLDLFVQHCWDAHWEPSFIAAMSPIEMACYAKARAGVWHRQQLSF
jgi:hypothetical protein